MSASIVTRGAATVKMRFLPGLVSLPNALSIGTVTTSAPGSAGTATITGTAPVQVLNLTIPQGPKGDPNSLAIGTVATGAPGSAAAATITGTAPAQTLNLQLPTGATGPANSLAIGTVTTGAAGSAAAAAITGVAPNQTLSLTIPKGQDGSGAVMSVAGRTGAVTLTSADVGLGNANNTSDVNKPVSTAQATALAGKADLSSGAVAVAQGGTGATTASAGLLNLLPAASVKTAGWTVAATDVDRHFVFNGSSAAPVTLPSGASAGAAFIFHVKNASAYVLTFTPAGSDTVDLPTLNAKQDCSVFWDGSKWEMIGTPRADPNASSLGLTGSRKALDGSIEQWGSYNPGTTADGSISFSIPFPSTLIAVLLSVNVDPGTQVVAATYDGQTLSGFNLRRRIVNGSGVAAANVPVVWRAYGY